MKYYLHYIFSFFIVLNLFQEPALAQHPLPSADTKKTDSLLEVLKTEKEDTNKVNTLNALSMMHSSDSNHDYNEALQFGNQALALAEKLQNKEKAYYSMQVISRVSYEQKNWNENLKWHLKEIDLAEKIGNVKMIRQCYSDANNACLCIGNYPKAMEIALKGLKLEEKNNDKQWIAHYDNLVGIVYLRQNNLSKSKEYFTKFIDIEKELGNKRALATAYSNMSGIVAEEGDNKLALDYLQRALDIYKTERDFKPRTASIYNSMAEIFKSNGELNEALSYSEKCLALADTFNTDKWDIANYYFTNGRINLLLNHDKKAVDALNCGIDLAKKISHNEDIKMAYYDFSKLYYKSKDYKKAYDYFELYSSLKDTLLNAESNKQVTEMNAKYETEKKDNEINLLNKDKEKQAAITDAENKQQKIIIYSVSGGLLLLLALLFFIFRGYKQKQNSLEIIEEKNREITDSINYAKRIQESILPPVNEIAEAFPNSFILFKPKDIVSGDFYWFGNKSDKIILAAVDCTGHGVPGAFMSLIGNTLLNQIVNENAITFPSSILNHLNEEVNATLKQTQIDSESRDGMDIAICSFDLNKMEMQYSGAMRPLYFFRNNELSETKPSKFPIGGPDYEGKKNFQNHNFTLQTGDTVYIFTDGFADQFNSADKKVMSKKFKEILSSIQNKTMPEQKFFLEDFIEGWKGNMEQTDDILVIGIKI